MTVMNLIYGTPGLDVINKIDEGVSVHDYIEDKKKSEKKSGGKV